LFSKVKKRAGHSTRPDYRSPLAPWVALDAIKGHRDFTATNLAIRTDFFAIGNLRSANRPESHNHKLATSHAVNYIVDFKSCVHLCVLVIEGFVASRSFPRHAMIIH
jgi:hypothetical protein